MRPTIYAQGSGAKGVAAGAPSPQATAAAAAANHRSQLGGVFAGKEDGGGSGDERATRARSPGDGARAASPTRSARAEPWAPEKPPARSAHAVALGNMLRRARESTAASATATKALIKTLQDVTQTTKRNDRDLNAALRAHARDWHRSLPLKFDGLVPGAHVASGRYATLPSSLKSPAASPRAAPASPRGDGGGATLTPEAIAAAAAGDAKPDAGSDADDHGSLSGKSGVIDDDKERAPQVYRDVKLEIRAMRHRIAARQRGKIAESVRRHNWFRPVLKKIGDATKTGPLPRCMLKFLGTAHRCIANGDEIDGDVFFQICALAFRGDDWKLPILSSVVPIVCDALSISHDALLAWFKRNGVAAPPTLQRGWRRRGGRGRRATHNARRGRGGAKAKGKRFGGLSALNEDGAPGSENGGGGILEEDEDEDGSEFDDSKSTRSSIKRGASS